MGCHATKTEPRDSRAKDKPTTNGSAAKSPGDDVQDPVMSRDDAEAYIRSRSNVNEGHARRMVATLGTTKDDCISRTDVEELKEKIRQLEEELSVQFKNYDTSGTGTLSPEEAVSLLMSRVDGQSEHVIRAILLHRSANDDDHANSNKVITVHDLVEFYTTLKVRKAELEARFRSLDADNSGDLDADELLTTIMSESGINEAHARALISEFDMDKNGTIDRDEFVAMWTNLFG